MSDKPIAFSRSGQSGLNNPKDKDGSKRRVNNNQPKKMTKTKAIYTKVLYTNSKNKKGITHKNHWG